MVHHFGEKLPEEERRTAEYRSVDVNSVAVQEVRGTAYKTVKEVKN
jgi:hypothetical protein